MNQIVMRTNGINRTYFIVLTGHIGREQKKMRKARCRTLVTFE